MKTEKNMRCRLCRGLKLKYKFKAKDHTLYQCPKCRFVQVAEMPSPLELEAMYTENYFSHNKYRDTAALEKENERRLTLTRRYLTGDGLKVLDFGCATGDFIKAAGPYFEMWGHDLSEYAVEQARQKNPGARDRIHSGLPGRKEYSPGSFDAVVLWDVIEHLPDPAALCEQLIRILKPGGFIFLSTPDIGAPFARMTGKYWPFMTPPEHLGFFSGTSIAFLFKNKLGCRILESKSSGKWANTGFIFYKLKRIFPRLVPGGVVKWFQGKRTGRWSLYVPTGDIRYVAAQLDR